MLDDTSYNKQTLKDKTMVLKLVSIVRLVLYIV